MSEKSQNARVIRFSKELYDEHAVRRAIEDYSDFCEIRIAGEKACENADSVVELEFSNADDAAIGEFLNYALGLTIHGRNIK